MKENRPREGRRGTKVHLFKGFVPPEGKKDDASSTKRKKGISFIPEGGESGRGIKRSSTRDKRPFTCQKEGRGRFLAAEKIGAALQEKGENKRDTKGEKESPGVKEGKKKTQQNSY